MKEPKLHFYIYNEKYLVKGTTKIKHLLDNLREISLSEYRTKIYQGVERLKITFRKGSKSI